MAILFAAVFTMVLSADEVVHKIAFLGDSITQFGNNFSGGYVNLVISGLQANGINAVKIPAGISGNKSNQMLERLQRDVISKKPDFMTLSCGVNDVWHEINHENGVEIDRFETVYRMMIEDTKKKFPNIKMMLVEPFVMHGTSTDCDDKYGRFTQVFEYAKVVKKLASEYNIPFVALQKTLDEYGAKYGTEFITFDGVHPNLTGAKVIADEWMKVYNENF